MAVDALLGPIFDAFSLPATVTPPGGFPIATRGVWITPLTESLPAGFGVTRREARDVLALRRSEVPEVKRGTIIIAAPYGSEEPRRWRVDGFETIEADCVRVIVVPDPEPS